MSKSNKNINLNLFSLSNSSQQNKSLEFYEGYYNVSEKSSKSIRRCKSLFQASIKKINGKYMIYFNNIYRKKRFLR